jgi:uncharacterized protein YceK
MWLLNFALFLIILTTSGCSSTVMVEMAVTPTIPTIANAENLGNGALAK